MSAINCKRFWNKLRIQIMYVVCRFTRQVRLILQLLCTFGFELCQMKRESEGNFHRCYIRAALHSGTVGKTAADLTRVNDARGEGKRKRKKEGGRGRDAFSGSSAFARKTLERGMQPHVNSVGGEFSGAEVRLARRRIYLCT